MPLNTKVQIALPEFYNERTLYETTGVSMDRLNEMYLQFDNIIQKECGNFRNMSLQKAFYIIRNICENEKELFVMLMQLGMDTQNFIAVGHFVYDEPLK